MHILKEIPLIFIIIFCFLIFQNLLLINFCFQNLPRICTCAGGFMYVWICLKHIHMHTCIMSVWFVWLYLYELRWYCTPVGLVFLVWIFHIILFGIWTIDDFNSFNFSMNMAAVGTFNTFPEIQKKYLFEKKDKTKKTTKDKKIYDFAHKIFKIFSSS